MRLLKTTHKKINTKEQTDKVSKTTQICHSTTQHSTQEKQLQQPQLMASEKIRGIST
jgi:hypothetical protein